MKFVMYGAGSIGRGFIGPLFSQAGYEVVFIDVNRALVDAFNIRREYHYTVCAEPPYEVLVTNVRAVDGRNEAAVLKEIAECDIMATSLGAAVLQKVAPVLAKGFSLRMAQSGKSLDILICENLKDAAHLLKGWILDTLPDEQKPAFEKRCGLVESAIGRMVPVAAGSSDPLHITVEEYGFLPVDRDAFRGEIPCFEKLVAHSPFAFYEERKLYLHNMGHAVCAYLGLLQGYTYIYEAVADPLIHIAVQSAMIEASAALSQKYHAAFSSIFDHAEDLMLRFSNRALGDTCERVARDPMRKLAAGDRFAGAIQTCAQHGVLSVYISLGFAAALSNLTAESERAGQIVSETARLEPPQAALVLELFKAISEQKGLKYVLRFAAETKRALRGDTV